MANKQYKHPKTAKTVYNHAMKCEINDTRKKQVEEALIRLKGLKGKKFTTAVTLMWGNPSTSESSKLFQGMGYSGAQKSTAGGCLTQRRSSEFDKGADGILGYLNPLLDKAIKMDSNIPSDPKFITRKHLPHFARWQSYLDMWYDNSRS